MLRKKWFRILLILVIILVVVYLLGPHPATPVYSAVMPAVPAQSAALDDYVKNNEFPISRAKTMKAGDATFHRGFTIHNAPGNNSDKMRQVMTIIYIADGSRVSPPKNQWQKNDLHKWLMGKPVGELIDSELNPKIL